MGRGAARSGLDWCLPTGLQAIACVGTTYSEHLSAEQLVDCHTHAPYFLTTLATARGQDLVRRLLVTAQGPTCPMLPVALSEWFTKRPILCRACHEESMVAFGYSHVQRHWLLPFVTRCSRHNELLAEFPAWTPLNCGEPHRLPYTAGRANAGLVLTEQSLDLLERKTPQMDVLGTLVQTKGFATAKGRLRRAALCECLLRYATKRYEHSELDGLLSSARTVEKLLSPLWAKRGCLHPIVARVLTLALQELPEVEQLPLWTSPRPSRLEVLEKAFETARTMSGAADRAGVSTTTAVVRALALGIPVVLRPKKLTPDLVARVQSLLAQGIKPSAIASEVGISEVSVYRIQFRDPVERGRLAKKRSDLRLEQKQRAWISHVESNQGMSKTELRKAEPALAAYLYRHCRSWYDEVTKRPAKQRSPCVPGSRSPQGFELELIRRMEAFDAASADGLRPRRSQTALLFVIGRPRRFPLSADRARRMLVEKSETRIAFIERRLRVAAAQLWDERSNAEPWRVVKKSMLRPSSIEASKLDLEGLAAEAGCEHFKRSVSGANRA